MGKDPECVRGFRPKEVAAVVAAVAAMVAISGRWPSRKYLSTYG